MVRSLLHTVNLSGKADSEGSLCASAGLTALGALA